MDTYTEKELQQMDAEARAEGREVHRKVQNWIADAERILASDKATEELKDLAAKFLVQARQVAAIRRMDVNDMDGDKYGHILVSSCQEMVRLLGEINEAIENAEGFVF